MPKRKFDEKTRLFMEFFESQGFKFVDVDTREPILGDNNNDEDKEEYINENNESEEG